ncbi:MAG: hypothetical protein WD266_07950 [Balneolales bacterium]
MNYALRNTIYLGVTLLLMVGSGWALIRFTQIEYLEELEETHEQKQGELDGYESSAENYEAMLHGFMETTYKVENHDKELMADHRVPVVYDYVRTLNQGAAHTEVNFSWSDSVMQDNYGYNQFTVNGSGSYRNLYNFVQRLERSKPLFKIASLQIQTLGELETLNDVRFDIAVQSYYNRVPDGYEPSVLIQRTSGGISHNPFFPLIHSVPPNEDNLIDIDDSRLIALSRRDAYLIDQQGALQTLRANDEVYLGRVQSINFDDSSITFLLNRGGLSDRVTLNIQTQL